MCPVCRSSDIALSKHPKLRDLLMRLWGMRAYRCLECRKRFYLPSNWERKLKEDKAWLNDVTAQESGERPSRRTRR